MELSKAPRPPPSEESTGTIDVTCGATAATDGAGDGGGKAGGEGGGGIDEAAGPLETCNGVVRLVSRIDGVSDDCDHDAGDPGDAAISMSRDKLTGRFTVTLNGRGA
jgi:hypothetical protein